MKGKIEVPEPQFQGHPAQKSWNHKLNVQGDREDTAGNWKLRTRLTYFAHTSFIWNLLATATSATERERKS